MPTLIPLYKCLLISPGDLEDERRAVQEAVDVWNAQIGPSLGSSIQLVKWETHSRPGLGAKGAQGVINEQMVDSCDFGIALFWSRLGTETQEHPSGSVEEIERLHDQHKDVMVFFCERPIPQKQIGEQYQRLQDAKARYQARGLLGFFETAADLQGKVPAFLSSLVNKLMTSDGHSSQPQTASPPDVRVVLGRGSVFGGPGAPIDVLHIEVQNHAPIAVFFQGVSISLPPEGEMPSGMLIARDRLTGTAIQPARIEPGDSISVYVDPAELVRIADGRPMQGVVVTDKIGRQYRSAPGELQKVLRDE